MPISRWMAGCILLVVSVLLGPSAVGAEARPQPRVLTSFLPLHSLVTAVAGSRSVVENWLPQGVDPHDFQFSPSDLRRLRRADLLIVAGLGLEGWKEADLRRMSGNERLRVVEASSGIPKEELIWSGHGHSHDHDDDHAHHDHEEAGEMANPHYWLDPLLFARAVPVVIEALSGVDPEGSAEYGARGAEYVKRLEALHEELERRLDSVRQVAFVTYHDAFPYFARRYRLRLAGVVEGSAAEQPSAKALADLSALVRREKARVLFTEGKPTRLARRLAADLGLRLGTLETLETGEFGAGAYEAGLRRNLAAIEEALRGFGP